MRMITSYICGGLGNQMFQYAAGRALALRLGVPLCLNINWFHHIGTGSTPRSFQLFFFPCLTEAVNCIDEKPPSRLHSAMSYWSRWARRWRLPQWLLPSIVFEPHFSYWSDMKNIFAPVVLHGYWQCEQYFNNYAYEIRRDFTFPPLPDFAQPLAQRIRSCSHAVSVHIRRGDYVSDPQTYAFHGLAEQEYYNAALKHIEHNCGEMTLFLFSDDPQWVREHFDCGEYPYEVVDLHFPSDPQHDMHLMSLCRHHIIANSSFSWWGAWLGEDTGLTVAPKKWFSNEYINTDDIIPTRWIKI